MKLHLSHLVQTASITQNPFHSIASLLQKCNSKGQLLQIHAQLITTGLIHNPPLASKLIASFSSFSLPYTISTAHAIAKQVDGLDTYTWNCIVRGYLNGNNPKEAFLVYSHVRSEGLRVDSYTLHFATKACVLMRAKLEGKQVQSQICKLGFASEIMVQTALLSMYSMFGELSYMRQVFDETPQRDLVMWNSVLAAYAQYNFPYQTLAFTRAMVSSGVRLNGVSLVSVLSSCSSLETLLEGKAIHGYVIRNLTDIDVFVYNAFIDMYSKCGSLSNAHRIFHIMPIRNLISWTSMMNGYCYNNCLNEALHLFKKMECENITPDEVTMLCIITTCTKSGSFELVDWIDHYVEKYGIGKGSITMSNALMDMHAKCGNIKKACQIFDGIAEKSMVSWTTIIHGLAMHGHEKQAFLRFCQMQREGYKPDEIVFLSVLTACSHAGMVDEGLKCFSSMMTDYGMKPSMEHYGCIVDVLCRGGLINEAFEFVQKMQDKPDIIIWRMLLVACRVQGDMNLANQIMNHLHEMGPRNSEDFGILCSLHAMVDQWDNVKDIRTEMKIRGVVKNHPGYSAIDIEAF
ncbi:pentatricopeptide repeat-containing protein At1g08070, chloroplastic-like [Ziziphus jujuba]|uniref:Pentatricopeptide repeat-containing protein At1g08070, chloroplastic-like n=1 Tax=Ziziphus jujuba TaxID=326968 RepID=A0ABM3IKX3_ZIZJJ|nr:pentatricopeptide repeat-containing protein At1g08070, chloroplastic-like [Ziziphus jujuba]